MKPSLTLRTHTDDVNYSRLFQLDESEIYYSYNTVMMKPLIQKCLPGPR